MLPPDAEIGTMENWVEWREKVIKFSRVEAASRPLIRKIVSKLDQEDVDSTEGTVYIVKLSPHSFNTKIEAIYLACLS